MMVAVPVYILFALIACVCWCASDYITWHFSEDRLISFGAQMVARGLAKRAAKRRYQRVHAVQLARFKEYAKWVDNADITRGIGK